MFDRVRHVLLRVTRVPAEPHPPFGAPGSVRVFRAGRNYYRIQLLRWGVAQLGAVLGICFSLWFLGVLDETVAGIRAARAPALAAEASPPGAPPGAGPAARPGARSEKVPQAWKRESRGKLAQAVARWPRWLFPLLHGIEYAAITLFICQAPFTYAATRLEFEQHWYIVTDRSLRIRTGLFALQESTMSFANLQQVEVQQGPLQRLLGLANVRVHSAGGGDQPPGRETDSLHTGVFHGVENALEIRDLILERLRRFRQAGLGDPDDRPHPAPPATVSPPMTLAAAQEMLAEARALRHALES